MIKAPELNPSLGLIGANFGAAEIRHSVYGAVRPCRRRYVQPSTAARAPRIVFMMAKPSQTVGTEGGGASQDDRRDVRRTCWTHWDDMY